MENKTLKIEATINSVEVMKKLIDRLNEMILTNRIDIIYTDIKSVVESDLLKPMIRISKLNRVKKD